MSATIYNTRANAKAKAAWLAKMGEVWVALVAWTAKVSAKVSAKTTKAKAYVLANAKALTKARAANAKALTKARAANAKANAEAWIANADARAKAKVDAREKADNLAWVDAFVDSWAKEENEEEEILACE